MKKILTISVLSATVLLATSIDENRLSVSGGSFGVGGDKVNELMISVDSKKYTEALSEDTIIGFGGSLSLTNTQTFTSHKELFTLVDIYGVYTKELNPTVSTDFIAGYTVGKADGSSISSPLIGIALNTKACCGDDISVGVEWKRNFHINAGGLPLLHHEDLDRYSVKASVAF